MAVDMTIAVAVAVPVPVLVSMAMLKLRCALPYILHDDVLVPHSVCVCMLMYVLFVTIL